MFSITCDARQIGALAGEPQLFFQHDPFQMLRREIQESSEFLVTSIFQHLTLRIEERLHWPGGDWFGPA